MTDDSAAEPMSAWSIQKSSFALTLTPCTVAESGVITLAHGEGFAVMISPSVFTCDRQIGDNARQTLGQMGADGKFAAANPDTIEFKLTFDGTGAVPPPPGQSSDCVETQVEKLKDVVYKYNGTQHEPRNVRLHWG